MYFMLHPLVCMFNGGGPMKWTADTKAITRQIWLPSREMDDMGPTRADELFWNLPIN